MIDCPIYTYVSTTVCMSMYMFARFIVYYIFFTKHDVIQVVQYSMSLHQVRPRQISSDKGIHNFKRDVQGNNTSEK